jgi:hypothetical protein
VNDSKRQDHNQPPGVHQHFNGPSLAARARR